MTTPSCGLVIMPRPSSAWSTAAALWVTAAGWAAAMSKHFGAAWVVTPDRIASPEESLSYTTPRAPQSRHPLKALVPTVAKTARSDLLLWRRSRQFRELPSGPWGNYRVSLIWQQHDLFPGVGAKLSKRLGVPLVHYVHAPTVWEANRWGVRRPIWGRLLEQFSESPQLRAADLIACVSEEVAAEIVNFGVPRSKVLVSPMSVDATRFSPAISGQEVRKRFGLGQRFVFGWTGSFRKYHGLDIALDAFGKALASMPDAVLLLVGDGSERESIERRAKEVGAAGAVVFAGSVAHTDIAEHVAAMDATLVVARNDEDFHYSPLKLREYMMCGKPSVIPKAGEMVRFFEDGKNCIFYEPGRAEGLADGMLRLYRDRDLARAIGQGGHDIVAKDGTWDARLRESLQALGASSPPRTANGLV